MTGAYQAKWDINLGLNWVMRQGYALPYYRSQATGSADALNATGKNVLLVDDVGNFRLPTVNSVDFRINKLIRYQKFNFNVDFDIFNLLNSSTFLAKQLDFRLAGFDQAREIMNPRIARIGVRVSF